MEYLTYAEVDLSVIYSNYLELCRLNFNKPVIPVIKADAYGHGATKVMEFLFSKGVRIFAVARVEEALNLKEDLSQKGIGYVFDESEVLVFSPIFSKDFEILHQNKNLIPIASDISFIRDLEKYSYDNNLTLRFGIEIDTGMGRLGIHYREKDDLFEILSSLKSIKLSHIMTHFPSSDFDRDFSLYQIDLFDDILEIVKRIFPSVKSHVSNSGGVLNIPEASKYDFARCGLSIYGYYPNMNLFDRAVINNSLTLKSRVVLKKFFRKGESISYNRTYFMDSDGYVVVIPCGYADAIPTLYSNNMEVLINGKLYRVVGRITMDYIMARVDNSVNVGDEVIIFGGNYGRFMRIEEFGKKANLIPYEITCGISKRVPRKYVGYSDSSAPDITV